MLNFSGVFEIARTAMTQCYFEWSARDGSYVIQRMVGDEIYKAKLYPGFSDVPEYAITPSGEKSRFFLMLPVLLFRLNDKDHVHIGGEFQFEGWEPNRFFEIGTPDVLSTYGQDSLGTPQQSDCGNYRNTFLQDITGVANLLTYDNREVVVETERAGNALTFDANNARITATGCAFYWVAQSKSVTYTPDSRTPVKAKCGIAQNPPFTCLPATLTLFFGPYTGRSLPKEVSACVQICSAH